MVRKNNNVCKTAMKKDAYFREPNTDQPNTMNITNGKNNLYLI